MVAPVRDRIAAGAALLDRYFGSRNAWTSRIDWTKHDQAGKDCIINQLFAGDYQRGLAAIGAPFRRTGDTTQRTGLNHGFSRNKLETSPELTRAWQSFLGVGQFAQNPAPAPEPAPAPIDPTTEARRLRNLVSSDAVFTGLRGLLDEFDDTEADYDYLVEALNDRRAHVIAAEIKKYPDGATQTAVIDAVNAADIRAAVLAY